MIDQLISNAAAAWLNRMLAREKWARDKLLPFAGRVARIEAQPFALSFRIADDGSLMSAEGEPAVTIGIALASLPMVLSDRAALMKNVTLQGDAEFAQALAFVLQNLRPEPAEELSRFIGDAAAERVVNTARAAAVEVKAIADRMLDNTANYVVNENPLLVARPELQGFTREVNALRDAVERLDKRIALLQAR